MRRILLLMILAGAVLTATAATAENFVGSLRSDYNMYQDAGKNDRFVFVQSVAGETPLPFMSKGWKLTFSGELRDSNSPVKGVEEGRITTLILANKIIGNRVDVRLGRFLARAGGYSPIDGIEIGVATNPIRATVAYGYEYYPLYRTEASNLPDRKRVAALLEGKLLGRLNWSLDHATRLKSGDIDDQVTTLGLRCRRFATFGWDARVGYDNKATNVRDLMAGILYKPLKDLQLRLRYSERRYRIYLDSFFAQYEAAPTKLAGISARYALGDDWLWLALGFDRRLRDAGDLDRITASVANNQGELGIRLQTGEDLSQIGGWLNVGGELIPRLGWGLSVNFDRWDSAWDAEPTEEWANSLSLTYELSSIADLQGRVEQYRTGELDSDIRGLLTFKLRYGL